MAYIKIIGRRELIRVSNERGREIKKKWLGDGLNPPAESNSTLDLGDVWAGKYSEIKSIEMEAELAHSYSIQKEEKEITQEEREKIKNKLKEIRENLMKKGLLTSRN